MAGAATGATAGLAVGGAAGGAIGAVIGAGVGLASYLSSRKATKSSLRKQKSQIKELRDTYLFNLDTQFNIEKSEAEKNSQQLNLTTDVEEGIVSDSFNSAIDNLAQQQEAEALGWNIQAQQAGQAEGASLSQLASSGTRNSSVSDAIKQEASLNAAQLQMSEDSQRTQDNYALRSAMSSLAQQQIAVQQNRTQSDNLVNSYAQGGNQYAVYKGTRDYNEKQYNQKIDEINDQLDDLSWNWGSFSSVANNVFNIGSAMLNGGTTGMSAGSNIGTTLAYSKGSTSLFDNLKSYFTKNQ